jgi:hypothetical protein
MKAYSKASDILHVLEPPPPLFQASRHRINSLQSSKHVSLVIIWLSRGMGGVAKLGDGWLSRGMGG